MDIALDRIVATLVLEGGQRVPVPLGGVQAVPLPADADRNGDGVVDATLEIALDATVRNAREWVTTLGFRWLAGYATFTPINGDPPLEMGPAMDIIREWQAPIIDPLVFPLQVAPIQLPVALQVIAAP